MSSTSPKKTILFVLTAFISVFVVLGPTSVHAVETSSAPLLITVQADAAPDHGDQSHLGSIAHAVATLQESGGIIQLGSGTFTVQQTIRIPSNIVIRGEGIEKTIIKAGTSLQNEIMTNTGRQGDKWQGISNVVVSDFMLYGNRTLRKSCLDIVAADATRSSQITVERIATDQCGMHGVHIKGATGVTIRDLQLRRSGQNQDHDHNLYLLRVTNAVVERVDTREAAGNGMSSTQLKHVVIRDLATLNNGRRGFRTGGSRYLRLYNVHSESNGIHPDGMGGDGIIVTTNDAGMKSAYVLIDSCISRNNRSNGVRVIDTSNVRIRRCTISGNQKRAIHKSFSPGVNSRNSSLEDS
jgi:hypothetical protein